MYYTRNCIILFNYCYNIIEILHHYCQLNNITFQWHNYHQLNNITLQLPHYRHLNSFNFRWSNHQLNKFTFQWPKHQLNNFIYQLPQYQNNNSNIFYSQEIIGKYLRKYDKRIHDLPINNDEAIHIQQDDHQQRSMNESLYAN